MLFLLVHNRVFVIISFRCVLRLQAPLIRAAAHPETKAQRVRYPVIVGVLPFSDTLLLRKFNEI